MLREAGILGPMRPDKALKIGTTFLRWGASPATGVTTAAIHHPHEIAIVDERGALSWERLHRRTNALAHSFAAMGIGHGDGVGIMCRNHRGFIEATLAAAKLGASALYLNTMFAGPQLVEVTRREGPKALVYDEEFAGLLDGVDDSVPRIVAWTTTASAGGTTLEQLIAAGDEADLKPPPDKPRFVILTSGTTGTPKGAQRSSPDGLLADRRAARQDPLPQPRDDDDRGAALPLLGLLPLRDEPADRLDDGAAAPLRPRGDAAGGPGKPRRGAGGGAGDDPADPQPARGDARRLRPLLAADHLALGLGAAGRAGDRLDGPLRRQRLQPLRLDRGRLRDDRHPRGPARRPRHRRQAAARNHGPALRRGRAGGSAGRGRPHLRRQRDVLRGLHRRRRQGGHRRPALAAATSATSTPRAASSSTAATTR